MYELGEKESPNKFQEMDVKGANVFQPDILSGVMRSLLCLE